MKERVMQVMQKEGLTSSRFAETIGIQRSAMSHIISGRNKPSLDVLMKILEKFTYINSDWLLFGKGNMEKDDFATQEPDLFRNTPEIQPNVQVVSENRREIEVKTAEIIPQPAIIEKVIPVPAQSKNVTKIMIFYSDNTFDTFIPEKNKKE
ncbi:MAG: helix-turn-helix domain-containing protein [Tannerellaceae bacterium]|nr:helix-turn-helix domain-containing protein [Tannerellaceae bacterium]